MLNTTQSSLLLGIPPVSHYVVYHNVTSDGDQGITAYDTHLNINVSNDQFEENAVYSIQVAPVNVIGQGPVTKTTLSKCCLEFSVEFGSNLINDNYPNLKCTSYIVTFIFITYLQYGFIEDLLI